ncbi:hypothetical protein V1264_015181 [Littorina saxatilis]|uniref:G-protein coupled receptors family 2 profile 2 domain-containing protein n=1 Tax=Littorina saxatilis TaxID=31220 RepID=A0AAN9BPJ8_9CAEN
MNLALVLFLRALFLAGFCFTGDADLLYPTPIINTTTTAEDANINTTITAEDANINTRTTAEDANIKTTTTAEDAIINTTTNAEDANINTTTTTEDVIINTTITAEDANINTTTNAEDANINTTTTAEDVIINTTITAEDANINTRTTAEDANIKTTTNTEDANINTTTTAEDANINTTTTAEDAIINTTTNAEDANINTTTTAEDANINTTTTAEDANINTTTTAEDANINTTTIAGDANINTTTTAEDANINTTTTAEDAIINTTTTAEDATINTITTAEDAIINTTTTAEDANINTTTTAEDAIINTTTNAEDANINTTTTAEDANINTTTTAEDANINTTTTAEDANINTTTIAEDANISTTTTAEDANINTTTTAEDAIINTTTTAEDATINTITTAEDANINTTTTAEDATINTTTNAEDAVVNTTTNAEDVNINSATTTHDAFINTTTDAQNAIINAEDALMNTTTDADDAIISTTADAKDANITAGDTLISTTTKSHDASIKTTTPTWNQFFEFIDPNSRSPYTWNRPTTGSGEYLTGFGVRVCTPNASTSVTGSRCTHPSTFPCHCSPWCHTYGTCCHDLDPDLTSPSPETGCVVSHWYAFVQCPAEWGHDDVRDRCGTRRGNYTDDEPVSDVTSNVTYRNEWCAQCHGVTSFTRWELNVTCEHFQWLYTAVTQDSFMDLVMDNPQICNLRRIPPEGIELHSCPSEWFASDVIRSCNVTGDWGAADYDVEVEVNCLRNQRIALYVSSGNETAFVPVFQNLFCAMCNGVRPATTGSCTSPIVTDPPFPTGLPPLSLLLGLQDFADPPPGANHQDCPYGQWLDLKNECRQLGCTAGKTLRNDTCTTPLTNIRGLVYQVDIALTVLDPLTISPDRRQHFVDMFKALTEAKLTPLTRSFHLSIEMNVLVTSVQPGDSGVDTQSSTQRVDHQSVDLHIRITGEMKALRDINRDDAELAITDSLFLHAWSVLITQDSVSQVSVSQDSVSQDSVSQDSVSQVSVSQGFVTLTRQLLTASDRGHAVESYTQAAKYEQDFFAQLEPRFPVDDQVPLSPLLVCPHAHFYRSEYRLHTAADNRPGVKVTLVFGNVEVELTDVRQIWLVEDSLYVCLDVLNSLQRPPAGPVMGELLWQYVLTMVVMPLSMLCLLLTLAVYCVLPPLRSLPGLNTMGTCCALLLAQLSLLLASHRVTSGAWCRALGVLVHVTWLSVFCWTSVCSEHMFRTFSARTRHHISASSKRRRLTRNIIVSILAPAAVVGAVVAVRAMTTDGGNFAYNDVSCYLDGTLLVGLAVVLPASLLLSLNLVLFALTVRRIHMVTNLNPFKSDERDPKQHVYACARLSVLTGATWIISLVAEGLGVDWLQFFSIMANGGQGVLLFLSYVTNRRVAAMLAVKMGCRKDV